MWVLQPGTHNIGRPTFEPVPVHYPPFRWWLLLPVAIAFAWVSAAGYQGLNGQDAHDYLHLAETWRAWAGGDERPVMVEHPHGYPMLGALLGTLMGTLLAMRIIPLLAWMGIVWLMHRVLRRTTKDERGLAVYVLLGVSLAPFLLRQAMTVMSDVPALFLIVAAFASYIRWREAGGSRMLLWMSIALGACLTIRTAAAPVVITMVLLMVFDLMQRWAGPRTTRILLVLFAIAVVITGWVLRSKAMLHDGPLAEWSPLNWFRRELRSDDGVLSYTLPNLVYVATTVVHPGQFPLGIILLPFFRKTHLNDPLVRPATIILLAYLLFVAGLPFQNDRVLLVAQPFVVIAFHRAFAEAWSWIQQRGLFRQAFVIGIAGIEAALFVRAMLPFIRQAEVEREVAATACGFGPARIYTHGMGAAFLTYCPGVPVTELWYSEIDHFDPGAFIVVRPDDLTRQWQGLPPATNWNALLGAGAFPVLQRPDGWLIARLP